MDVEIVDTTLRDGEQSAGLALNAAQKIEIARLLDSIGVCRIEAGVAAMGGEEKKSIEKIASLGLNSRISSWNRLNLSDIRMSMECGVDIIHISVPASDIQIAGKLGKSREWVADNFHKCVDLCKNNGFQVSIGLEDASRADMAFIFTLLDLAVESGIKMVRYADTVGILTRKKTYEEIGIIRAKYDIQLEMHAHNDFGLAVPNSVAAVQAGAVLVSCTAGGIGERAGNCNLLEFAGVVSSIPGMRLNMDIGNVEKVQNKIIEIMNRR